VGTTCIRKVLLRLRRLHGGGQAYTHTHTILMVTASTTSILSVLLGVWRQAVVRGVGLLVRSVVVLLLVLVR
jgi:hypothetical protein